MKWKKFFNSNFHEKKNSGSVFCLDKTVLRTVRTDARTDARTDQSEYLHGKTSMRTDRTDHSLPSWKGGDRRSI